MQIVENRVSHYIDLTHFSLDKLPLTKYSKSPISILNMWGYVI